TETAPALVVTPTQLVWAVAAFRLPGRTRFVHVRPPSAERTTAFSRAPGEESASVPTKRLPCLSNAIEVTAELRSLVHRAPASGETNKPSPEPAKTRAELVESTASAHTG